MSALRSIEVAPDLLVYVSDVGFVVIQQSHGDETHVFLDPKQIPDVIAALQAIQLSASAKQSAAEAVMTAEYEVWRAGGRGA